MLAPQKNLYLVGNYYAAQGGGTPFKDPNLLYTKQTNLWFNGDNLSGGKLKGSSLAVSIAAGKALKNCYAEILERNSVDSCLKKLSMSLK